jgi:signal transduction histidine kinase/DNA-binding response OmpR family regulator
MKPLRILHLEDDPSHAMLMRMKLAQAGLPVEIVWVTCAQDFQRHLNEGGLAAVVLDNGLPGFSGTRALEMSRERAPKAPVIVLSGSASEKQVAASFEAGASEYVVKGHWWQLLAALRRVQHLALTEEQRAELQKHDAGMSRLVKVVQELSQSQDLATLMLAARTAGRQLTEADGAMVILKEGDHCIFADEDAIAPLWKGRRVPIDGCICGWAMKHGSTAAVEDVYADSRIPPSAYRGTFVKSLLVAPIRARDPLGAIGVYWAKQRSISRAEIDIIEAVAHTAGVVMENIHLCSDLDRRVQERTLQLEDAIRELEAFSYSVSHDLRSPLQTIGGFAELVALSAKAEADPDTRACVAQIQSGVERMTHLVDDLLRLSQIGKAELHLGPLDLSAVAWEIVEELRISDPERTVDVAVQAGMDAQGDAGLMRVVLRNLLGNAWKYTARKADARIEFGVLPDEQYGQVFFVRDNGAGFDPASAEKLFAPFQRLHATSEFSGNGIGLATVQRAIHRHTGRIWATGEPDRGATFFFTLPAGI